MFFTCNFRELAVDGLRHSWPFQTARLVNHIAGVLLTLLNALAYSGLDATGQRGDQVR